MHKEMTIKHQQVLTQISVLLMAFLVACYMGLSTPASAKTSQKPTANPRYATLVVDANTGTVLHQENADKYRYPASLTKMMTLYLAFEAVKEGKLQMEQPLRVSAFAASRPKMNMGLRPGQKMTVEEAILSLIVRSANDSAVVLAEAISGSEPKFATKMTERARDLGMMHTAYRNASGLPDAAQKTTAYDLARLAIALRRDFPEYYPLFSRTNFTYNGTVYPGHNRITSNYPGCDGLKTGFVNASGFNLVSSAKRGETKVVAVVMGGQTARSRDQQMITLLDRFLGKAPAATTSIAANSKGITAEKATYTASSQKQKATVKQKVTKAPDKKQALKATNAKANLRKNASQELAGL